MVQMSNFQCGGLRRIHKDRQSARVIPITNLGLAELTTEREKIANILLKYID